MGFWALREDNNEFKPQKIMKEAKIQMREEPVGSEIDEPDAAQGSQLEYRELSWKSFSI